MSIIYNFTDNYLIKGLQNGKIAVVRTDTIYGIVAHAFNESAVETIFKIKGRDTDKPLIVLVASIADIPELGVQAAEVYRKFSATQPTSIIVPQSNQPSWLTRGQGSVAYRVPSTQPKLLQLLRTVGPLVAPSANPQGLVPAATIQQAVDYFGEQIDFYVDGGEVPKEISPSKLIRLDGDTITALR